MNAQTFTADQLSKGSRYWMNQVTRGYRIFTRTNWNKQGWDRAQILMDKVGACRNIARACRTYGPCSRECVGL